MSEQPRAGDPPAGADDGALTEQPPPAEDRKPAHRPRFRARRIVKIAAIVAVAVLGLSAGGIYLLSEHLGNQVKHYPGVFSGIAEGTRPPAANSAMTFVLVGSDSLSARPTTGTDAVGPDFVYGGQRSDVLMLVQTSADDSHATVVSVPRDSWVPIPGHGMSKINAAFAWGGPSLLVRTLEGLTGIRMDHLAVVDFAGFQALTDAVGGIEVNVAAPTTMGTVSFTAGRNHLDGQQALAYVRQRDGLTGGDLARVQRQQSALRALLVKATSNGLLSSPVRAYEFLDTLTHWITVDDTLTNEKLRSLAWQFRNLRSGGVTFLTAPVAGPGREGGQSVVYLDLNRAGQLWQAMKSDDIAGYLRNYPASALGSTTP